MGTCFRTPPPEIAQYAQRGEPEEWPGRASRSALRRSAPTWRPRRLHGPPPEDRGRRQGSARLGGVGRTPLEDRLGAALAYRVGGFPGLGVQGDHPPEKNAATGLTEPRPSGTPLEIRPLGPIRRAHTPRGVFLGRVALGTTPGPGKRREIVDDQDLYTTVITTYIPPRQVGDGPWTPWYADYYHPAV